MVISFNCALVRCLFLIKVVEKNILVCVLVTSQKIFFLVCVRVSVCVCVCQSSPFFVSPGPRANPLKNVARLRNTPCFLSQILKCETWYVSF